MISWGKVLAAIRANVHLAIVMAGILLALLMLLTAWPANAEDFGKFLDSALKILAIILVGAVLPRLTSLEFGTAKLTFANDTKKLGEMVNALSERLARIEQRLAASPIALKTLELTDAAPPAPDLPPVTVGSDPQKGRFGGLAMRDGYSIAAVFPEQGEGDLARIVIEVRRMDGPLDVPVTLYLHHTFDPDQVLVSPLDGVARLDLVVWGGFTVGAQIHNEAGTRLELDLTAAPGAPRIVRER